MTYMVKIIYRVFAIHTNKKNATLLDSVSLFTLFYKLKLTPRTMFRPIFGIPSFFNLDKWAIYLYQINYSVKVHVKCCFTNFTVPPRPKLTKV
jgi:hypothetical protein